jgi:hypothetical protein
MTSILKVNSILHPSSGTVEYRGLPAGNIVNVTTLTHSTPTSVSVISAPAKATFFGGSFTKKYSHTHLAVECLAFGQGVYSGNCGTALVLDYNVSGKECWDYGVSYGYDNSWQPYQIICCQGHSYFTQYHITGAQIEAGSHTMHFGMWVKRADQGGNRPFNNLSPNASTTSDSRVRQTVSSIVIREIGL